MEAFLSANRANWDDRVAVHAASSFYDVEGWLAGERTRWSVHRALGEVAGLDLVHLQCHFGLETLQLAQDGARVTGLDFSPAAITEAKALASRAGLGERSRFVVADVLHAAAALAPQTFDLAYVSLGSLCWLPSVQRWANQVAALLRPGGRLHLHDVHPLALAMSEVGLRVDRSYFEEPAPHEQDAEVTYTESGAALCHQRTYEWNHSIGEVVTALLDNGLQLTSLIEHDWTLWPQFPWLEQTESHRWSSPSRRPRVPLSFSLVVQRPGIP